MFAFRSGHPRLLLLLTAFFHAAEEYIAARDGGFTLINVAAVALEIAYLNEKPGLKHHRLGSIVSGRIQ